MSVTIYDIAKKANVSYSTASRVLNKKDYGKRSDSLKRAEKIIKIAKEEGYQANSAAQALAWKSTKTICLSISNQVQSGWSNAYFAQILEGVENACHNYAYHLTLNTFKKDNISSFFKQRKLANRGFDGMVLVAYVTNEISSLLQKHGIPFISTNKLFENNTDIPAYFTDGSGLDSILYAYRKGHRKIAFVSETIYPDMKQIRALTKAEGLTDCKIIDMPISVPGDLDSGPAAMEQYFKLRDKEKPTVIVANYQTCAALLKEFKKHGLRCPNDISLISRCESEICKMLDPEITVIAPNLEKIGYIACEKLIRFLEEGTPAPVRKK